MLLSLSERGHVTVHIISGKKFYNLQIFLDILIQYVNIIHGGFGIRPIAFSVLNAALPFLLAPQIIDILETPNLKIRIAQHIPSTRIRALGEVQHPPCAADHATSKIRAPQALHPPAWRSPQSCP